MVKFDQIKKESNLFPYLRRKQIIFIFDNCDYLLTELFKEFMDKICKLMHNTVNLQVVVTSLRNKQITDNFQQLNFPVKTLTLQELTKNQAIKYF